MVNMLRFDPFFRDIDHLTQQLWGAVPWGTAAQPALVPMDAWRDGEKFVVKFDLPGVLPESLDVNVEHDVLTVRAERPAIDEDRNGVVSERPRGVFSRQVYLGHGLDTDNIHADYVDGVLRLTIPVAEAAKPRKIEVAAGKHQRAINA
ncbi:Hsp20/alpha crystallin family protein [Mycobacterium avium]|uniref:Hsp20/alpha crystallin family protein n=1 Tax=Mycobacterium avium TaxID=1764 RepID=UPI00293B0C7A|nr:HSP20 family small heat-shock protein [Mycobacterium avium]MDV3266611.1 Hsp20 family protein [Mycobacterium avium]